MEGLVLILAASWFAGLTSFFGGLIAYPQRKQETVKRSEINHGIVAFGGGLLVSAVAFALVPEGMKNLHPVVLASTFCAGGLVFGLIDLKLKSAGGSKAQFLAMLMDFVPEALSLGAIFDYNQKLGILLAAFIAAQNLPEGYNSYRELVSSGTPAKKVLIAFGLVSLLGPLAAFTGHYALTGHEAMTAGILSFAAGGVLYLIFEDIAPKSTMERHWAPPFGAVLGFLVGMVGKMMIG